MFEVGSGEACQATNFFFHSQAAVFFEVGGCRNKAYLTVGVIIREPQLTGILGG